MSQSSIKPISAVQQSEGNSHSMMLPSTQADINNQSKAMETAPVVVNPASPNVTVVGPPTPPTIINPQPSTYGSMWFAMKEFELSFGR